MMFIRAKIDNPTDFLVIMGNQNWIFIVYGKNNQLKTLG